MTACILPELRARAKSIRGVSLLTPGSIPRMQTLFYPFTHSLIESILYHFIRERQKSTQKVHSQPPLLLFHYFQNPQVPALIVSCCSGTTLLLTPHSLPFTPLSG